MMRRSRLFNNPRFSNEWSLMAVGGRIILLQLLVVSSLFFPHLASALSITTFNILAPVHRSMDAKNTRESERDEWWRPRAEYLAEYAARQFRNSDIVLLQEWWFRPEFEEVFDYHTSSLFHRVAERRPGDNREDGMAVLIRKRGDLELVNSLPILTGPQRIAQLVQCRHAEDDRPVAIANVHLSFPSSSDPLVNERRQACEIQKVTRALERHDRGRITRPSSTDDAAGAKYCQQLPRLELLGGDFNSNSQSLAAQSIETKHGFVNCASAHAEQALSHTGGQVNLGITHKQHNGLLVSVDHIFARVKEPTSSFAAKMEVRSNALKGYGYLDAAGTRILDCCRGDLDLGDDNEDGGGPSHLVLSDHRPVTARLEWPPPPLLRKAKNRAAASMLFHGADFCNAPLDPLEPPSYMGGTNMTALMLGRGASP